MLTTSISGMPKEIIEHTFSFCDLETLRHLSSSCKTLSLIAVKLIKPYGEAKLLIKFFIFRNITSCVTHEDEKEYVENLLNFCEQNHLKSNNESQNHSVAKKTSDFIKEITEKKIVFSPDRVASDISKMIKEKQDGTSVFIIDLPKQLLKNKYYRYAIENVEIEEKLIFAFSSNFILELEKLPSKGPIETIAVPRTVLQERRFIDSFKKTISSCTFKEGKNLVFMLAPSMRIQADALESTLESNSGELSYENLFEVLKNIPPDVIMLTKDFQITDREIEVLAKLIKANPKITCLMLFDEVRITNTGLKKIAKTLSEINRFFFFQLEGYSADLDEGIKAIMASQLTNHLLHIEIIKEFCVPESLKRTWKGMNPKVEI